MLLDMPPGMKPGPSDQDLEKPILEKLYAWGAVLVLFMAIWIPVVWLKEPSVNESDQGTINAESVSRGHLTTLLNSRQDELRPLLGLPDAATIGAIVPLGYPAGRPGPVRRRPLEEVVFWDSWGNPA